MASPSFLRPHNYSYDVFSSFHGPDARKTLLSHIREQFNCNGITMFDDEKIERGATITPSLVEAIQESRIAIVILSKKYASSSWCLDELVKILECKKTMWQIMTIFYGVEPSDVRKQTGKFGIAFNKTCARKTDKERQKWSQALNEVGNIIGEDFLKWDNEANMIKKISKDVSDKLNATPSRDFYGMVGLEAHLREMESLLDLDYDGVKMVAIFGPAGIGKSTIARALHNRLSNRFQLTCFVDNLRESYHIGLDEYGLKLRLQEQFLSKLLNQNGMRIFHLGVIKERLCKQRVLVILDDVNNIMQLEALANETTWFGLGSRIVVTTENKELLQLHKINNMYTVGFPSFDEAVKILCRYAFRHSSPRNGFEELAESVTWLCGKLPLGLRVVGSSLYGKKEGEWENVMNRLEDILDRDIEDVLRVGYESLDENKQLLFLHIAVFFNNRDGDLVKSMFANLSSYNSDVKHGLKVLESRSLIEIDKSTNGERIKMHRLLQQVGRKAIHKQEPWKRQILMDANDIRDALEDGRVNRKVVGISFDISGIYEVSISKEAFTKMPNLRFLRVYKGKDSGNYKMQIPGEMDFPRCLRLLDWEAYPSKSLPPFQLENLVELKLQGSQLEYMWQGTQPLNNLKLMDLTRSRNLKELPNLSNAKNLEKLYLSSCESLAEIPSSCSNLHKLTALWVNGCKNLQFIPADMNLASLEWVFMRGCSRLRNIPVMSENIKQLYITNTSVEDVQLCSHLEYLDIRGSRKFKGLTHLPTSVKFLQLNNTDIERIPDFIKDLHGLHTLTLCGCRRLTSLPELPDSLLFLYADDCESLETVYCPFNNVINRLNFTNCFKLGEQARRGIIQQSIIQQSPGFLRKTLLPGRNVPGEFGHPAKGNTLTIRPENDNPYTGFVFCVVISPHQKVTENHNYYLSWRRIIAQNDGYPVKGCVPVGKVFKFRTKHLFIFHSSSMYFYKDNREIVLELSSKNHNFDIIECGAKIYNEESIKALYESGLYQVNEDVDIEFEPIEEASEDNTEHIDHTNGVIYDSKEYKKHINYWSWLFLCFCLFLLLGSLTNYGDLGKLGFRR